jgi:hypothetical protein
MYDMAKRSLAFTVATGGLLLTGTGYAPAEAAVGFGSLPGPAQAQGAAANQAPSSVSTPISVRGPEAELPKTAPLNVHVLKPAAPHVPDSSGAGASATSTVKNSGGILSGNTVQIPINLGLNLCTNQVAAVAAGNHVAPSNCGGSNAAGGSKSGSSATASTSHSGGILSGNTIQAPVNVPLEVCGNQAVAIGLKNTVHGTTCPAPGSGNGAGTTGGGAKATAVTDHSGGILSGNIIQAPVNVPVNACGNQANVIAAKDKLTGSNCSTNPTGSDSYGGSSATAVVLHSGGLGSGNTIQTPINVPVNACGNQANVIGLANRDGGSDCVNEAGKSTATSFTAYSGGIAAGNSAQVPINVPVNACGNQVNVIGAKNKVGGSECFIPGPPSATSTSIVTHSGGALAGNEANVPINVPLNVCGNQADVIGLKNKTGTVLCGQGETPPAQPSESASASPSMSASSSPSSCSYCTPPPSESASASPSESASSSPSSCSYCTPPPSESASASPSESASTSASPSTSATNTTPGTPSTPAKPHGSLAGTGTEEGAVVVVAGAALLAGVGLRAASKRGRRQH